MGPAARPHCPAPGAAGAFLYPLRHHWERGYVGAGVALYDAMAVASGTARRLRRHRHLTRKGALREAPCLRKDAVAGAVQYWDAQVDDARHTLTVVRTAALFGALAANRSRSPASCGRASG